MKAQRSRISAYALIHDANRILLCRLSKEMTRWEGLWTLPGGGLEFGERPEDTVVREVEEETGLVVAVRSIAKIDSLHDTSGPDDFHGIRILYHVDILGGRLRHEPSGSTDRCEWHRLHPTPDIPLVDLAEVGVRVAQEAWPLLPPPAELSARGILRPIAVCVFAHRGRILVSAERDASKNQTFYRPIGGGIEFGESSAEAITREVREELGVDATNLRLLGALDNIFTYNGRPGHEIVMVYDGEFADRSLYERESLAGIESNGRPFVAAWHSLDHFSVLAPLYPVGLTEMLRLGST